MGSTIGIEQLAGEIERLTREYTDEVKHGVYEAVLETADEAREALAESSPESKGKSSPKARRYKSGWRVKRIVGSNFVAATVHGVKPTYRLAHLLEKGHAKRNGGRVSGIPHIAPIEQMANERVEQRIIDVIERG